MNDFFVVIPARYGSSRLPGKPLLDIAGKTMIQRVYEQAQKSAAKQVLVATDDERIVDVVKQFGGSVCLTRKDHESGTDRLQEVAQKQGWNDDAIVVNVQGDEPLIPPAVINQVANNLANQSIAGIATLCEKITTTETLLDPNAVKVVADAQQFALYFSRAPIPYPRDFLNGENKITLPKEVEVYRHIGLYAYRCTFLHQFVTWPAALLERIECLEQLRAMANGVKIHIEEACEPVPGGVDTEKDWLAMQHFLEK